MAEDELHYIRENLGVSELLAQLAEEAGELAHAALKLRRVYDGKNPAPIHPDEAFENLLEEIGDVDNCLEALELDDPKYAIQMHRNKEEKIKRWAWRLRNKKQKG